VSSSVCILRNHRKRERVETLSRLLLSSNLALFRSLCLVSPIPLGGSTNCSVSPPGRGASRTTGVLLLHESSSRTRGHLSKWQIVGAACGVTDGVLLRVRRVMLCVQSQSDLFEIRALVVVCERFKNGKNVRCRYYGKPPSSSSCHYQQFNCCWLGGGEQYEGTGVHAMAERIAGKSALVEGGNGNEEEASE
jgi:hypothetical protein